MADRDMGRAVFRAIADFAQVRREARQTERDLAALRREAERPVRTGDIDRRSNFLEKGKAGGADFAKGFLKGVGKLAIAAPVVGGAAAGALAGAASLLTLASSMTAVAGAGLALPGVFAGIKIASGVLKSVAADAAVRLADIKTELDGVQDSASNNFWYFAEKPIRNLSRQLMPELKDGIENIGWAWGELAATSAKSAGEAFGGGKLGTMLGYIRTAIDRLAPAMDPIIKAFVTLSEVGLRFLPEISDWIVKIANKFNDWVQKANADGSLETMFRDGLQALKDFGSIIGSVLQMVGALVKAATMSGAESTLHGLAEGFKRVADMMNAPVFQNALSTIFEGAGKGGAALSDALVKIGDAFVRGAPALSKFLELAGQILGLLIGGLADAISNPAFGAGLNAFMEGLKVGVELLVPLLPGITTMIGELLAGLAPFMALVVPALPLIAAGFVAWKAAMAGWALGGFIASLGPLAAGLGTAATAAWGFAAALLANPITWIILAIVALVAGLIWFFTQTDLGREIWGGFMNWLKEVIDGFVVWWNTVFVPAIGVAFEIIKAWLAGFFAFWSGVWNMIVAVVTFVWNAIVAWVSQAVANIMMVLSVLGALGAMAWEWFMGMLTAIQSVGAAIFSFVASIPGTVIGWLVQLAQLGALAWGWFMGMLTSAMDAGAQLFAFVAGIPGQVIGFLGNLGSLLLGAGQSLIQGFIDGISSMIGAVGAAVGGVMDFIGSFFPASPAERGAFSGKGWTPYRGKAVMTGFAEGIIAGKQAGMDAADEATLAVSNRISPTLTPAGLIGGPPPGIGGDPGWAPPPGLPPAAPAGGTGAGLSVTVINPAPEPPSQSIQRTYQKIAYLGLDAKEPAGV